MHVREKKQQPKETQPQPGQQQPEETQPLPPRSDSPLTMLLRLAEEEEKLAQKPRSP